MDSSAAISSDNRSAPALRSLRTVYFVLVGLYLLAMAWVWGGIIHSSGSRYIGLAPIQALGFAGTASVLFAVVFPRLQRVIEFRLRISSDAIAIWLVVLVTTLIMLHWVALGHIPVLAAFAAHDETQAALIRDSILRTGIPLLGYIPTLTIWSGIPFLGIYFIHRRQYKLSWLILFIGFLYALSLMQKSYPLIVLAPPALYCLLTRRFTRMALIVAMAASGVLILFFAANPHLRPLPRTAIQNSPSVQQAPTLAPAPPVPSSPENLRQVAGVTTSSLLHRVLLLPGDVVAQWFATFPDKIDYEEGCGYRFVARLLGCEFKNNPEQLYAMYYPESFHAGVQGTYNAAHFAEEYANFGPMGLALSGILAAVALAMAAIATCRAGLPAAIALNLSAIMALTSGALHTTLLSGGWMTVMVLAYALYPPAAPALRGNLRKVEKTRGDAGDDLSDAGQAAKAC